jgi:uncharacterized protein
MPLSLRRLDDVQAFLEVAGSFLAEREAEHNLIFGICSWLRAHPELVEHQPTFLVVTDADDRVVMASLRTPPHNQVLSMVDDLEAVDLMVDALATDELPGVVGPKEAAARFAERWAAHSGGPVRGQVEERIFRLERVIPPRSTPGSWRLIEPRDRALLARWIVAFSAEAVPEDPPVPDPEAVADRWVARVGRLGYVWDDGGEVVSLVGAGGETPNGIRIGPVYTPPERRGRGYASALTAAASQDQLDRGRRFVFLFTDLANPTSNKIYQAIGYEPVCDVDQYVFGANA